LVFVGAILAEEGEGLDAAFELEGEAGRGHVLIAGADVVEKTG
jgi:hypothetical protein